MIRRLLSLLTILLFTGCGTMSNMKGTSYALMGPPDRETRAFGGVANDIRWAGEQAERVVSPPNGSWGIPLNFTMACYFGLVDLPLSLVGDIITLPQAAWPSCKCSTLPAEHADNPLRRTGEACRGSATDHSSRPAEPMSVSHSAETTPATLTMSIPVLPPARE